jgi:hypothetical protein
MGAAKWSAAAARMPHEIGSSEGRIKKIPARPEAHDSENEHPDSGEHMHPSLRYRPDAATLPATSAKQSE